jgi:hypothetical protein
VLVVGQRTLGGGRSEIQGNAVAAEEEMLIGFSPMAWLRLERLEGRDRGTFLRIGEPRGIAARFLGSRLTQEK